MVPLGAFALQMLDEVPRFLDCDYVFTTTRKSPVSGFSKALRRLSEGSQTTDWRWHDLRRTAASGMARLSVAPHVVEKVLNHVSGSIAGVAAVYNRHGYNNEKRDALEQWGSALARTNVMNMPAKRMTSARELKAVNLRVREDTRALIDRAASLQGRSRTDFMIEASRRAAEEVILDQRVIMVSQESYDHFLAILDRPPEANEKLVKLLRTKAPWEQ